MSNFTVVTFAGSEIHKKLQVEFNDLYAKHFNIINWDKASFKETKYYRDLYSRKLQDAKYFGYFIWKPFIINDTLVEHKNVLYLDVNFRIRDIPKFLNLVDKGFEQNKLVLFKYPHFTNIEWTKRELFSLMELDEPRYWYAKQIWTSILGFTQTEFKDVFETYWKLTLQEMLSNDDLFMTQYPEFKAHRWEQSILSLLVEKHTLPCLNYMDLYPYVFKEYPKDLLEQKKVEDERLS